MRHHVDARPRFLHWALGSTTTHPHASLPPSAPARSIFLSTRLSIPPFAPHMHTTHLRRIDHHHLYITPAQRTAHPTFSLSSSCVRNLIRVLLYTVFNCTFVSPLSATGVAASLLPLLPLFPSPLTHSSPPQPYPTHALAPAPASIFSLG